MYVIGVDIGGTNLKVGLISNMLIDKEVVPTNSFDLVKQIINTIDLILSRNDLSHENLLGIGVGCPGIVDNGVVVESINLNLRDFSIKEHLESYFNCDVIVKNDGDMATLGEHKYGAGENVPNMLMLTIGTGIGGGVIINNQLLQGNRGCGEFGHINLIKNGIPCNCGRLGCFEKYASYTALLNMVKDNLKDYPNSTLRNIENLNAQIIYNEYKNGDGCATFVIEEYTDYLKEGILDYCNIFKPDKIVVGGGISYVSEIINIVKEKCKKEFFGYRNSSEVDIVPAKLQNDSGMLGAKTCFDNKSV
jgi:glucokinase